MKLVIHSQTSMACTIEVWEWISNSIPHFIMGIITYPCWDFSWSKLVKQSFSTQWGSLVCEASVYTELCLSHWAHGAITTSLLWHNNDVIIASCGRWVYYLLYTSKFTQFLLLYAFTRALFSGEYFISWDLLLIFLSLSRFVFMQLKQNINLSLRSTAWLCISFNNLF